MLLTGDELKQTGSHLTAGEAF